MDELLSAGDVEVQAAVVGSYPKVLLFVLDDTACNIVAQRILERNVLYVLEAIADGVVIIQSAEIRSQPHAALRVHEDTTYGALRQAAAFYGIAAVGHERVVAFMVDVEIVESSYPQAVL